MQIGQMKATAELQAKQVNAISSVQVIKAFGAEDVVAEETEGHLSEVLRVRARLGVFGAVLQSAVVLVTSAEVCTDGMSDREYGIGATLMIGTGDAMTYYAGCCTVGR